MTQRERADEDVGIVVGSANVFADLDFEEPDEELAKAKLVLALGRVIRERGLTQVAAGALMGISQPKVSALLRGHSEGFSIERLLRLLTALDRDVDIVVKPAEHSPARVNVLVAV